MKANSRFTKTFAVLLIAALLLTALPAGEVKAATITVCSYGCNYTTIQEAIDAASNGDTIEVAAGIYDEGFSVVNKSNLTIIGAGNASTLIEPASLIDTNLGHKYTADMQAVVFVNNSTNITIEGMAIKSTNVAPGAGGADAIVFWNASTGAIKESVIKGIYTISGAQTGQGIALDAGAGETATLSLTNTDISGFQKNGIDVVDGNSTTLNAGTINLNISGGSIAGAGPISTIAQNGVMLWNKGGGTLHAVVDGLTLSGFIYTPDGTDAIGFLNYGAGANGSVSILNSDFSGNELHVYDADEDKVDIEAVVANNTFDKSAWIDGGYIIYGSIQGLAPEGFKDYYKAGELITVIVGDASANLDPVRIEEVTVHVISTIDTFGIDVTCTETGLNTGLFTGSFTTTTTLPAPSDVLAVKAGAVNTVTAKYGLYESTTIVDDAKPTISGLTPANNAFVTADAKPTIKATLNDVGSGIDVDTAEMIVDGGVVAAVLSGSSFSYTPANNLSQGLHTVTVNVSDVVGNPAVTASWSFTVDTVKPVIANQKATPNAVKPNVENTIVFTAEVSDATSGVDTVKIDLSSIGGSPTQDMLDNGVTPDLVANDGTYTAKFTKTFSADANYILGVTAKDKAGNSETANITLRVSSDLVPPVITDAAIEYPFGLSSARPDDDVVISAMVTDDVELGIVKATAETIGETPVTIFNIELLDNGVSPDKTAGDHIYTGLATVAATAPKGSYPITITAKDAKANEATDESLTLVVDPGTTGFEIELVEGWNLISLPLVPHTSAIETFLSELIANESVIQVVAWPYDLAEGTIVEKRWNGINLVDVTKMVDGVGYWVEMSESDTLTFTGTYQPPYPANPSSYEVYAGWNLIGFKSIQETFDAYTYLGEAGVGNMRMMFSFDEINDVYVQILGGDDLTPREGYWLAVSTNATIYPPAY